MNAVLGGGMVCLIEGQLGNLVDEKALGDRICSRHDIRDDGCALAIRNASMLHIMLHGRGVQGCLVNAAIMV